MVDRVGCVVPGCRRTIARAKLDPKHDQYLCQPHFSLVDKALKRLRGRVLRKYGAGNYAHRLDCRIWRRMVRQAIERAAGI
jgi:hypothetical protein